MGIITKMYRGKLRLACAVTDKILPFTPDAQLVEESGAVSYTYWCQGCRTGHIVHGHIKATEDTWPLSSG